MRINRWDATQTRRVPSDAYEPATARRRAAPRVRRDGMRDRRVTARRAGRVTEPGITEGAAPAGAETLREAAAALTLDLMDAPAGRMDTLPDTLAATLTAVQDAAKACTDAITASAPSMEEDLTRLSAARMTLASLDELQRTAGRVLGSFADAVDARREVVWLDRPFTEDARRPPTLRVAPLEVGPVLRDRLERTGHAIRGAVTVDLDDDGAPASRQACWPRSMPALPARPSASAYPTLLAGISTKPPSASIRSRMPI